jgi:hypothetical protein
MAAIPPVRLPSDLEVARWVASHSEDRQEALLVLSKLWFGLEKAGELLDEVEEDVARAVKREI